MTTEEERRGHPESDHRGSGWTLWREIYGTFIGALPLVIAIVGGILVLVRDVDRHSTDIVYLKEADARHESALLQLRADSNLQRTETLTRLDTISVQLSILQQAVARIEGRNLPGRGSDGR
jgi:hypothetical protein